MVPSVLYNLGLARTFFTESVCDALTFHCSDLDQPTNQSLLQRCNAMQRYRVGSFFISFFYKGMTVQDSSIITVLPLVLIHYHYRFHFNRQ
jgi:hypothetical protein